MQFTPAELSILRQAAEIILRAQVAPAAEQPPLQEVGLFTVTHEWIDEHKTPRGAWKAKQLRAINVMWPPARGWPERVEGTKITQLSRRLFESFSGKVLGAPPTTTGPDQLRASCSCDVPPWEDCPHTLNVTPA